MKTVMMIIIIMLSIGLISSQLCQRWLYDDYVRISIRNYELSLDNLSLRKSIRSELAKSETIKNKYDYAYYKIKTFKRDKNFAWQVFCILDDLGWN